MGCVALIAGTAMVFLKIWRLFCRPCSSLSTRLTLCSGRFLGIGGLASSSANDAAPRVGSELPSIIFDTRARVSEVI